MSPGLDARFADAADFGALRSKLEAFAAAGATHVSLAYDDVPARFADPADAEHYGSGVVGLATAHADWANRVLELGLGPVWMCPTEYVGTAPTPYLERLGAEVEASVDLGWTGTTVVSAQIRTEEAAARAATLRRRPVVWDNHPVNDTMMRTALHLGPLQGRARDLDGQVAGFYWNPMTQARASLVPLLTAAEYAQDPGRYDAEAAWERAVRRVGGDASRSLAVVADACRVGPLEPVPSPAFAALCDAAIESLEGPGWRDAWEELAAYASAAGAAASALAGTALGGEIAPWTAQIGRLASVLQAAVAAVRTVHGAGEDFMSAALVFGGLVMSWQQTFEWTEQVWGERLGLYPGLVQGSEPGSYGLDAVRTLVWDRCHVDRLVRAVIDFAGRRLR